jgi:hypothetical protein
VNVERELFRLPKIPKILQSREVSAAVIEAKAQVLEPVPQIPELPAAPVEVAVEMELVAIPEIPVEVVEIARITKPVIHRKPRPKQMVIPRPPEQLPTQSFNDELDWKKILSMSLDTRSVERIASERSFAQMMVKLRRLCPETTWICMAEESKYYLSQVEIIRLQTWFERLIAEPVWPHPKEVFLIPDLKTPKKTLAVVFPKLDKKDIPYSVPASNLIVLNYQKNDVHGLTVFFQETFNLNRAGNA